jgi:hypothetical protein
MSIVQGQPANFQFWNLSPAASYVVKLTSGATYSGVVFGAEGAITNASVKGGQMSFDTVASDSEWLAGSIHVGLMITSKNFGGHANIAAPVVMEVNCLGSTTTQADTFSVDIGFEIPPACIVCGAGPDLECPAPMQLCGYAGQFYRCVDCPEKHK